MKIKISALDSLFSKYIRTRDDWTCQKCGKKYNPPTQALHCAHIFSRKNKSTRFDPDNALALCYGCHSYLDREPLEKYEWYKSKFGEEQFSRIQIRSKIAVKIDELAIALWLRKELGSK